MFIKSLLEVFFYLIIMTFVDTHTLCTMYLTRSWLTYTVSNVYLLAWNGFALCICCISILSLYFFFFLFSLSLSPSLPPHTHLLLHTLSPSLFIPFLFFLFLSIPSFRYTDDLPMRVKLYAYNDGSYTFTCHLPQTSWFLKKCASIETGAHTAGKTNQHRHTNMQHNSSLKIFV